LKSTGIIAIAALAVAALVVTDLADAKRLGGGRSLGAQRSMTPQTPPAATTPGPAANPVMPAQPGVAKPAAPAAAAAAAAPAAKSGMSKWLGPIAGLAAGLGLAALLSHFGLSEGFASLLLMALLAVGVVFLVRMFLARRTPAAPRPMQYAGAGGLGSSPGGYETQPPATPAAVAPAPAGEPVATSAAPSVSFAKPLPPGFDAEGFVRQAKLQFNRLQAAFDAGDRKALADVMTPTMAAEIAKDLDARGEHKPTEVLTLNAEVLEVTTEGGSHWASVRFTGTLREDGELFTKPFDEVWNLTKPADGATGWLLAGIQQLEAA
jgi:predicted lipid-binding transport protein (Tim44 family)